MKYAKEVIDLLAAYPGREFRMIQIVRHVTRARVISPNQRNAVRIGIFRVLEQLRESGQVEQKKGAATSATYAWRSNFQRRGGRVYGNDCSIVTLGKCRSG